jgi:hypothetical protein
MNAAAPKRMTKSGTTTPAIMGATLVDLADAAATEPLGDEGEELALGDAAG